MLQTIIIAQMLSTGGKGVKKQEIGARKAVQSMMTNATDETMAETNMHIKTKILQTIQIIPLKQKNSKTTTTREKSSQCVCLQM